jgi:hypothetical protein
MARSDNVVDPDLAAVVEQPLANSHHTLPNPPTIGRSALARRSNWKSHGARGLFTSM